YRASEGQMTTGYTMTALEKIGLLKMDFLGLKTLTVISEAVKIIKRTHALDVDINTIDLVDKKTYELFAQANTLGVFQLESSGMRELLRKLKPDKFEDIVALLALYRPGPLGSGMVDDFIKRKRNGADVSYDHPLLEPVLKDTYGIILYQEQVMRITNVLAGFSLAQADLMRRAMGKKDPAIIENLKKTFIDGATAQGIGRKVAEKIFGLIEYFAGYGFNKSHSAAYALISVQTAFLKANYPVAFMAALLTSEKDDTDKVVQYITEAKRMKINILPPDINESYAQFTVVGDRSIRFGLCAVKNVGEAAVAAIIEERRKNGPFRTLFNFCERLDARSVNRRLLESLVKCGAFDHLGQTRAALAASLEQVMNAASALQKDRQSGQMLLFEPAAAAPAASPRVPVPEWSQAQLLAFEKEMLGFYITAHPLDAYQKILQRYGICAVADAARLPREQSEITVAGIVEALKTTFTKKTGEKMAIIRLEDRAGFLETLVFPETYSKYGAYLAEEAVVVIQGKLDRREEALKLIASRIIPVTDVSRALIESVRLVLTPEDMRTNIFAQLKPLLSEYPGSTMVHLVMKTERGQAVRVKASAGVTVESKLLDRLESILGKDDVAITLK
ncbi:MAG: DNA polymerase III subunit alpha, partial [Candidatus Omnitrophica bacterium]|nr:DNA polymerase III subunit alpha [Candidatus Omnitrophota bacterium]